MAESKRRYTENERKVWAERYDDGDVHVEVGHMGCDEIYLQRQEAHALHEILTELIPDKRDNEDVNDD